MRRTIYEYAKSRFSQPFPDTTYGCAAAAAATAAAAAVTEVFFGMSNGR